MKIETIPIRDDCTLTAYVPDPVIAYQTARKRPGIVIAPGGAYLFLSERENEAIVLEFLAREYNVYVLNYSVGFTDRKSKENNSGVLNSPHRYPDPILELREAIHYLKVHDDEMNLEADQLFLLGFSAGGHLCAAVGTMWNDPQLTDRLSFVPQKNELKAAGMVLCYPMIHPMSEGPYSVNDPQNPDSWLMKDFLYGTRKPSREQMESTDLRSKVTKETIPAFVWQCTDDPAVNPINTTEFVLALQKNGIDCEYMLFDHGQHGIAMAKAFYAKNPEGVDEQIAQWMEFADLWMKRIIELQ